MAVPERISIVGPSGAGKTTLSKRVSAAFDMPRLELDSLQHQPNWTALDPELFRAKVRTFVEQPRWVIDGNYTSIKALDLIWARADHVLWLDLPRHRTFPRVVWRTLRRALAREELWNGNRERLAPLLSLDRDDNFWLWVWDNHAHVREKYERRTVEARWGHLEVTRLRNVDAIERWLSGASRTLGRQQ